MILGAVHRSPGICLTAEENPGKPQLGDHLDEGDVRPVIVSNEVSRIAQHVGKGIRKLELASHNKSKYIYFFHFFNNILK